MIKPVSIIMPVHNRWEHTKQSLGSLVGNTANWDLFKLYVVDDLSDKENRQALIEYHDGIKKDLDFDFELILNNENIGPGASRNKVCERIEKFEIHPNYIYHSDNDVYFVEGWLEKLIYIYEMAQKSGVRLLGAGCHPYLKNNTALLFGEDVVGIKDAVSGYSQFMTWHTWRKYGPFDETMRGQEKKIMGSEDWAFCQKIIKDGFKVGSLEPELVIATGKTNTYGELATGSETFKQYGRVMIK